jgi:hypothetical protein
MARKLDKIAIQMNMRSLSGRIVAGAFWLWLAIATVAYFMQFRPLIAPLLSRFL